MRAEELTFCNKLAGVACTVHDVRLIEVRGEIIDMG